MNRPGAGEIGVDGAAIRMARHLARKVARRWPWLADDAESAALYGVAEAAAAYDPARGIPFRVFARPRVRGAILDDLRRASVAGYRRGRHGPPPEVESIGRRHAALADPGPGPAVLAARADLVAALLGRLPDRERAVVVALYGLDGAGQRTLHEAGRVLGCSHTVVHKFHERALARLRSLRPVGRKGA